jgi:hypothetical protein
MALTGERKRAHSGHTHEIDQHELKRRVRLEQHSRDPPRARRYRGAVELNGHSEQWMGWRGKWEGVDACNVPAAISRLYTELDRGDAKNVLTCCGPVR